MAPLSEENGTHWTEAKAPALNRGEGLALSGGEGLALSGGEGLALSGGEVLFFTPHFIKFLHFLTTLNSFHD